MNFLINTNLLYQKLKMIFTAIDDSLFFHFAYLCGKTASVNLKIVGKLLPVKRDIEACAVRYSGAAHKIGEKLLSR